MLTTRIRPDHEIALNVSVMFRLMPKSFRATFNLLPSNSSDDIFYNIDKISDAFISTSLGPSIL